MIDFLSEDRTYTANASAVPFHEADEDIKVIVGPVGSGKSSVCAMEIFLTARESDIPVRSIVIRESWPQLRDSTLKTLEWWFGSVGKFHKSDRIYTLKFPNYDGRMLEHEIHMRHAQRAADATKFLSTEYGIIWLEEPVPAFDLKTGTIGMGIPKEVFEVCVTRKRQAGFHRVPQLLCSFNPPSKFHWCHEEFCADPEGIKRKGYHVTWQPAFENEDNLPPGYYDSLMRVLSPDLARRFVRGESVTLYPGIRVFPFINSELHFADGLMPVPGIELTLGWDFGLTPVCLISQVLPNGRWLILEEIQRFNMGITRLSAEVARVLRQRRYQGLPWHSWGDPAGQAQAETDERTCFQILDSKGFPVRPGAIPFEKRKAAVEMKARELCDDGLPALRIDKRRCPILTEGWLGGYRYPKAQSGEVGDRPLKNEFSHVSDAAQMIATGEWNVLDVQTAARQAQAATARAGGSLIPKLNPLRSVPKRPNQARSWMGQ